MLCSLASLSPSVSLAKASEVAFLSLQVILAPTAMFFKPGGTIIGGRGLSESGSTYELSWMSLGVPLKAGEGNLIFSGTLASSAAAASWTESKVAITEAKETENATREHRERFRKIFIIKCIV